MSFSLRVEECGSAALGKGSCEGDQALAIFAEDFELKFIDPVFQGRAWVGPLNGLNSQVGAPVKIPSSRDMKEDFNRKKAELDSMAKEWSFSGLKLLISGWIYKTTIGAKPVQGGKSGSGGSTGKSVVRSELIQNSSACPHVLVSLRDGLNKELWWSRVEICKEGKVSLSEVVALADGKSYRIRLISR